MIPTTLPTGARIVEELVTEMEAKLYPIVYRTVPPQEFHVYVHPDDYREIESLVPLVVADAQRRLDERVDALNHRPRWTPLRSERPPIEVPSGGWAIFFHPDANDQLARGDLGIVSRLSIPSSPTYGGTPTVRIGRTVVTEGIRTTTVSVEPAPRTAADTDPLVGPPDPLPPPSAGFATLTYRDEQGPHVFVMRKEAISIGRGGSAQGVDVQIAAGSRVSRRHCRIRRDAAGTFVLEDTSAWGTSVDGVPVPAAGSGQDGDAARTRDLPPVSRIALADAVVITFSAHEDR
jgi:hypothetical protein